MIVSKNGKSYDQSDGSEQPHAASAEPRERSEREEINRRGAAGVLHAGGDLWAAGPFSPLVAPASPGRRSTRRTARDLGSV